MRAQDRRTGRGLAVRYVLLVLLGALTGVLLSRLLFPVVFGRGGPFVLVAFAILLVGVVLIARLLRREGAGP